MTPEQEDPAMQVRKDKIMYLRDGKFCNIRPGTGVSESVSNRMSSSFEQATTSSAVVSGRRCLQEVVRDIQTRERPSCKYLLTYFCMKKDEGRPCLSTRISRPRQANSNYYPDRPRLANESYVRERPEYSIFSLTQGVYSTKRIGNKNINKEKPVRHGIIGKIKHNKETEGLLRHPQPRSRDLAKCKQTGDDVTDQAIALRKGNNEFKINGIDNGLNRYKNSKNKYKKQQYMEISNYLCTLRNIIILVFVSLFSAIGLRGLPCFPRAIASSPMLSYREISKNRLIGNSDFGNRLLGNPPPPSQGI